MFDVLMYLFETYVQSELDFMVDQDALTDELTRAGFQNPKFIKHYPGWNIWLHYTIVRMRQSMLPAPLTLFVFLLLKKCSN